MNCEFTPRAPADLSPLGSLSGWMSALLRARGVDTEEKADRYGRGLQSWRTQGDIRVELPAGECELRVVIATPKEILSTAGRKMLIPGVSMNYIDFVPGV